MPPINEGVKAVMRGVRRKLGTAQKGKAPVTAAVVAKLVKRIPDDLSGKRDKALILIGFAAALRRSELVVLMARQALGAVAILPARALHQRLRVKIATLVV